MGIVNCYAKVSSCCTNAKMYISVMYQTVFYHQIIIHYIVTNSFLLAGIANGDDHDFISTGSIVLRVPLLFGPVENINECGGTYLYNYVRYSGNIKSVCHFQQRFPTHVNNVASVLRQMAYKLYKVRTAIVFVTLY